MCLLTIFISSICSTIRSLSRASGLIYFANTTVLGVVESCRVPDLVAVLIQVLDFPLRIWVCLKMSCTPKPNGFADHYPY